MSRQYEDISNVVGTVNSGMDTFFAFPSDAKQDLISEIIVTFLLKTISLTVVV